MPFVTSGELRSRIKIERPIGTVSPTGGVIEGTPEVFADRVPARIASAQGSEAIKAGGIVSGITHTIAMRYQAGVKSFMTVTFEGRQFQIVSIVDTDERHVELLLLCVETL